MRLRAAESGTLGAMARIGLVLGAGGVVGAAFHEGVLRALTQVTSWDPREADVIVGTSAGSHVAARLRAGRPTRGLGHRPAAWSQGQTPRPRRRPSAPGAILRGMMRPGSVPIGAMFAGAVPPGRVSLQSMVDAINGYHPHGWPADPLWLPAVRVRDGVRVAFGRAGAPPCDVGHAVAASCAIPGYFAPVEIEGESYVDGGAHSPTNADLLADQALDLVVVVAPMAVARGASSPSAMLQARGFFRLQLAREARTLRRRGTEVVAFSPTAADLEVMGWNAMAQGRSRAVTDRAYASAVGRLEDPRWAGPLEPLRATARMTRRTPR
ncbi:MAG: patatin-like phospholipase family protein [Nitriliruptorales bacterium]|nr:patatin-like phospholipase family protein [Nitriliruptorales bacterium]